MEVVLESLSKLYAENWIFRKINVRISEGERWAIRGHNGSGKSTLISMVLGLTLPTEGKIIYQDANDNLDQHDAVLNMTFSAPYMTLLNELSPEEFLKYYRRFRQFQNDISIDRFLEITKLTAHRKKRLGQFSTGMLQRFRLGLAFLFQSGLVILDEPTSNLDVDGKEWMNQMIDGYLADRTLVIASNEESDLSRCDHSLEMTDYS